MMRPSVTALSIMLAAALLSCSKQSLQNTYDAQEKKIESFASARNGIATLYKDGSVRVIMQEGHTADSLLSSGAVTFYYAGYILNGTSVSARDMFATNRQVEAEAAGWDPQDEDAFSPVTVAMDSNDLIEGLRNGLLGVRGGEECYILFSGKHAYGKRALGTIPAKSALVYHVWVESMTNE